MDTEKHPACMKWNTLERPPLFGHGISQMSKYTNSPRDINQRPGGKNEKRDYALSRPLDKPHPHILGWPHVGTPAS